MGGMTRDKILLTNSLFGGLIGGIICVFWSVVEGGGLLNSLVFTVMGILIGIVLLFLITYFDYLLVLKGVTNYFLHFVRGFLSGVSFALFWTLVIGFFTKWFEGWAFVIGIGACLIFGIIGALLGIVVRWEILKFSEQRDSSILWKFAAASSFLIITVLVLFFLWTKYT